MLPSSFKFPTIHVSRTATITVLCTAAGVTLLGFFASRYLGRRRRAAKSNSLRSAANRKSRPSGFWRNLNGDVPQRRNSVSPLPPRLRQRHGSISWCSECQSTHSASTATLTPEGPLPAAVLTPQQLGVMGMEALDTAIAYWEEAMAAHTQSPGQSKDFEEPEFSHLVESILEAGYDLREQCSHLFLFENSVIFRSSSACTPQEKSFECDQRTVSSVSSAESFVSAHGEIGDIKDFEEFGDFTLDLNTLVLYQAGLKQVENNAVPYRVLRTAMLKCRSDTEYLAKVHCIRLAFQYLLENDEERMWFVNAGNQLLTGLLIYGDKDPKDCLIAYDEMLSFVEEKKNWPQIEEELRARGVKCMSFYDIVLDFLILDAFEDLENPPSVVIAVAKNRWLSYGFKETALATAVWSVLKAKRRIMKFPNGFISHSYDIFEHLSPVLAWGFLGPDEELKDICVYFKDEVLGFLQDIFNLHVVRYTKVEELATDIFTVVRERYERACQRMSL